MSTKTQNDYKETQINQIQKEMAHDYKQTQTDQ